jgi:phenylacetate-coenzyme A ligase PaaK-like adenylate-forming protein
MSLRRLSPREYLVNLVAVTAGMPVYARREWADRPTLDRFAFRRAREMAIHAVARVPLYRDRYAAAGVDPRVITGWAAFARLPLMDKAAVRDGFPDRSVAEGADLRGCILSTSSGSSGLMMTIPHRADRLWPYLISSQRMLRWAAEDRYPFWYRQAYVYTSEYPLLRVPGFYPLMFIPTAAEPDRILDALARLGPHVLHTYPTVLRDLVALAPARMAALRLRGVSVGSELSTQAERDGWGAVLGVPVRDEYSTEELGRIASQCPEGRYHLHEDIVHTEIVGEDGRPTDGVGEVVGTELHNRTMPFVRYRQGDLARISDEPCPCGRHTRLLVDLVGRANDGFLLRDGRMLPAGFLLDVSYRGILGLPADTVSAYRFVQRDPDTAVFEVVPGVGWTDAAPVAIAASLRAELPASIVITVAVVEAIARRPGGKRSTVVREF